MTLPDSEALRRVAEAADNGPGPLSKLADREWQDLLERDDRTSPEDYPDMCLINRAEFGGVMSEAYLLARDAAANRISELEARVGVLEGAMSKIADGKTPPDQHGHYLAHREAVKIARAALQTQEPALRGRGEGGAGEGQGVTTETERGDGSLPVPSPQQYHAGDASRRAAFRAGWYVNAAEPPDQTEEYLAACEAADYRDYCASQDAKQ